MHEVPTSMKPPWPALAMLSLLLPMAVFWLLIPIMDTGNGLEFGSSRAHLLGAGLALASAAGGFLGVLAFLRNSVWGWRMTGIAGAVLGFWVANLSLGVLWFFRPN